MLVAVQAGQLNDWSIDYERCDMRATNLFTISLIPILLLLLIFTIPVLAQAEELRTVPVYFFWGDGCPYCEIQKQYLPVLAARFPQAEIQSYEVWNDADNRQLLFDVAAALNFEPRGVPVTVIGNQHWVGFAEPMIPEMEAALAACLQFGCPDYGPGLTSASRVDQPAVPPPISVEQPSGTETQGQVINVPLIGAIDLGAQSLFFSTALIAFVDGFNPCSLWVLSILLALVINTGSRKKVLLVGLTFLVITTLVYGLFITGLFSVFSYVSYIGWIQIGVALLALAFAVVNIKDYFWYKKGVSLTISEQHKPKIYKDIRNIMSSDKSTLAMIGATVVMALGIALVELPCTAGFPVIWSNLIAANQVPQGTFAMLLGLYLLIYLLDELIVFVTVVVTLKASKLEEKHGRVLKLVGGMVMLTLAIVLVVNPELMNDFSSSLSVFAGAFLVTAVILLLHRKLLPQFGILIGSEFEGRKRKRRH
jgi:glutaredoxin